MQFLKYLCFRVDGVYPCRGPPHEQLLSRFQAKSLEQRRSYLGENDVEYAEFSMAQGMVRQQSPVDAPASPLHCGFEEKIKLLYLFDSVDFPSRGGGNTVDTADTSLIDFTPSNMNATFCEQRASALSKPEEQASGSSVSDLSIRKKLKQRFKPIAVPKETSMNCTNRMWSETVPLTQNTKESVMGPLESFLKSIHVYPEHDQQQHKKKDCKDRKWSNHHYSSSCSSSASNHMNPLTEIEACMQPSMSSVDKGKFKQATSNIGQFTLPLNPLSPPPLSENVENMVQPSTSNGFSWTPSLLIQRRSHKSSKQTSSDLNRPEKDAKHSRSDNAPHSA